MRFLRIIAHVTDAGVVCNNVQVGGGSSHGSGSELGVGVVLPTALMTAVTAGGICAVVNRAADLPIGNQCWRVKTSGGKIRVPLSRYNDACEHSLLQ